MPTLSTVKVRGTLPPYVVKDLKVDRLGVMSGTVLRYFKVGVENQRIDPKWLTFESVPDVFDIACVGADAAIEPPMCIVTYHYEGSPTNLSGTFASREDQTVYELDDTMAEQPIETHPSFVKLAKLYGWDKNERRFAETLTQPPATGNAANNAMYDTAKKTTANPLFGIDSWLSVGVIFRKTYVTSTIPAGLLDGIGTIVQSPPDSARFRLPDGTRKRNWLKLAPKITQRGNVLEIIEEWMLSGPRGWLQPIYSQGQLNVSST